jgi:hypothetical protein
MIQIGTHDYEGDPITTTRTPQGAVYRSEARVNEAARASGACERTDPHECRDDIFDPRSNGTHLTVVNGIGPTGDGDLDLQQAAIGAQLEQTAVMARPEVSPAMPPESARCLAKVQRDGVADECRGVVYWLPGRVGDAVTPPATAGWRHVDPVVDEHHTPEVQV